MLANKDSTAETMLQALAHTSGALDAAIELDVDRTPEDRVFFQAEKATIEGLFAAVESAARAVELHDLQEQRRVQTRVEVGDIVLDRGARRGKKRVTIEVNLKTADLIFGEEISEIVDAERHLEPASVLQCVGRLEQSGDFAGKSELVADLKGRADRQAANFTQRTRTEIAGSNLEAACATSIAHGADGLYKLEKRLLERFPREKVYVRAFFLDVGRKRVKSEG